MYVTTPRKKPFQESSQPKSLLGRFRHQFSQCHSGRKLPEPADEKSPHHIISVRFYDLEDVPGARSQYDAEHQIPCPSQPLHQLEQERKNDVEFDQHSQKPPGGDQVEEHLIDGIDPVAEKAQQEAVIDLIVQYGERRNQ